MKKGQKKLFKFINKTFKNAIILQQLRIDEFKLCQELKKRSEKVSFPSGGEIKIADFGGSKNEESCELLSKIIIFVTRNNLNC